MADWTETTAENLWTMILMGSVTDHDKETAAIAADLRAAYERGVREERSAVVAWLRDPSRCSERYDDDEERADAIDRGEHVDKAKKSEILGEKVYCRIARDTAEDELRALGVSVERAEDKPTVLVLREHGPRVVFTEDDISLMRACVHEHDGDPASERAALRARVERAERAVAMLRDKLQAAEERMTSALGAVRAVLGATGDEDDKG